MAHIAEIKGKRTSSACRALIALPQIPRQHTAADPLTSEPPLPDAQPLTSEPPLARAAALTSEGAAYDTPAGPEPAGV
ncbi:hypothetical protein [Streptomyces sp. NPDC006879]|uniref:hypothetical protein n=1 Tax=Streptomyces sp. NPDC006879 TaxID=3364767 RepID=UPI00369875D6